MSPLTETQQQALAGLRAAGADVKLAKSGRVHTIDFRSAAEQFSPEHIAWICALDVRKVELASCNIDDSHVTELCQHLGKLQHLDLQNTSVSDECLEAVRQLEQLKFLLLTGSRVTRDGITELRKAMIATRIVLA